MSKRECSVSRSEFRQSAKPLIVSINGEPLLIANPKFWDTGTFGWKVEGECMMSVNGTKVECKVSLDFFAIGSKNSKE